MGLKESVEVAAKNIGKLLLDVDAVFLRDEPLPLPPSERLSEAEKAVEEGEFVLRKLKDLIRSLESSVALAAEEKNRLKQHTTV